VTRLLDRKSIAAANAAFVLIMLVNTMLWIVKPMMSKSVSTVVEITRHHAVLSATSSVKQYSERKNQTADVAMIESVTNTLDMEVSTSSEQVTSVVNDTAMDDATSPPDSEVIEDSIDSNCDLFMDVTSVELTKRKNRDANTSRSPVSKAKSRRPSRSRSPDSSLQSDSLSCSYGKVFTSLRQIREDTSKRRHPAVNMPLLIVTVENLLFSPELFYEHMDSECQF
jgi:hypothetical protein